MSITICRKINMNDHRQITLPKEDGAAIVTAIRAAGLDAYYNEAPEYLDGLMASDLREYDVDVALASVTMTEAGRGAVRQVLSHARNHAGNAISFTQYAEGGALAIGSHPHSQYEMTLANGNAFALFDALGLPLDGYSGEFRASALKDAAPVLALSSALARYMDRLIAVCDHALAHEGPDAMIQAA